MRIWLTAPFADHGVEELETDADPVDGHFSVTRGWYRLGYGGRKEGVDWHRTKEAAIAVANEFRQKRIADAVKEAARLMALPPLLEGGPSPNV